MVEQQNIIKMSIHIIIYNELVTKRGHTLYVHKSMLFVSHFNAIRIKEHTKLYYSV